jgi:predicted amidohydrolase
MTRRTRIRGVGIAAHARCHRGKILSSEIIGVKVAAYQADLATTQSIDSALVAIRERVDWCESNGIEILCCPEGVLGGLADYAARPADIAINVERGQLEPLLSPLASDSVTTIVGFTEVDRRGRLFNAAAVFHNGAVLGIYRKLHPAINKSVYCAGTETPVLTVGGLTFGIVICYDSRFAAPARAMALLGATALFVPSNNGLPPGKAGPELVDEARATDVARARENGIVVIRADVAGRYDTLVSYGSSTIVSPEGRVLCSARSLATDQLVAELRC